MTIRIHHNLPTQPNGQTYRLSNWFSDFFFFCSTLFHLIVADLLSYLFLCRVARSLYLHMAQYRTLYFHISLLLSHL